MTNQTAAKGPQYFRGIGGGIFAFVVAANGVEHKIVRTGSGLVFTEEIGVDGMPIRSTYKGYGTTADAELALKAAR